MDGLDLGWLISKVCQAMFVPMMNTSYKDRSITEIHGQAELIVPGISLKGLVIVSSRGGRFAYVLCGVAGLHGSTGIKFGESG